MPSLALSELPSYETPPVIEVVIGAQFEPINGFLTTHYGAYWQRIRENYPRVETASVLAPMQEHFGGHNTSDVAPIQVPTVPPLPRLFFIDPDDEWLIQLQQDRFLLNWRRNTSATAYPRFPAVLSRFEGGWQSFLDFCQTERLAAPVVNQLEVTYINHIPTGEIWKSSAEIGRVFPEFQWRPGPRFLPAPEATAWRMAFVLPNNQGRLHVAVRQAIRREDEIGVLLCELTVRGKPATEGPQPLRDWIHLAREWIVRGFADLVSEQIQVEHWGRVT